VLDQDLKHLHRNRRHRHTIRSHPIKTKNISIRERRRERKRMRREERKVQGDLRELSLRGVEELEESLEEIRLERHVHLRGIAQRAL